MSRRAIEGLRVAITGGARGIGLATAQVLAERGAHVVIGDIDTEECETAAASLPGAVALPLDVADPDSVEHFVAGAGNLDVLVNNAGVMPLGPFLESSHAGARRQLEINLLGVMAGMRSVLPSMVARGDGQVVNVASMGGRFALPGAAAYSAGKAGVITLSDAVRRELRGSGVTITTVLPAMVDTGLASGVPRGRGLPLVTPERVANVIVAAIERRKAEVCVPAWLRAAPRGAGGGAAAAHGPGAGPARRPAGAPAARQPRATRLRQTGGGAVSAQAGERAARRRAEILDAAERVFADRGYHQAGIADIAADLGIGHGTFYRYFDNKHAIAQAVFDRVVERIGQAALEEDPESASTLAEYRAQVERLLGRMFGLLDEAPALMAFLHDQTLVVDSARLSDTLDGYSAFTARFLENGVARGYLRQDLDVEITAQALVGVILEGTRRELRAPEQPDLRRRWIAGGVALMFDGISAREKSAAAP